MRQGSTSKAKIFLTTRAFRKQVYAQERRAAGVPVFKSPLPQPVAAVPRLKLLSPRPYTPNATYSRQIGSVASPRTARYATPSAPTFASKFSGDHRVVGFSGKVRLLAAGTWLRSCTCTRLRP